MPPKRRIGRQGRVRKGNVANPSENPPNDLPEAKPPFPAGLAFIDSYDSDARRQVRSHVMKQFMYHKRCERNEPVDSKTRSYTKNLLVLRPQDRSSANEPLIRSGAAQKTEEDDDSSIRPGAAQRIGEEENSLDENTFKFAAVRTSSPVSSFSSFRSDPFSSFPIKVLEKDRVLVNHYSYVYPNLMFRFQQSYNPVQTICLNRAMQGPIAFQAVMVIGAAHISVLRGSRGLDTDSTSIQQKVRALHMLNDGISRITEETYMDVMFGILSLASAEDRFGSPKTAWLHLQGAIRIMERFRDIPVVKDHHTLTMYYNWVSLTSTGYDEYSLCGVFNDSSGYTSPLPSSPISDSSSPTLSSSPPPAPTALTAFNEFILFLRNVERLSFSHGSSSYPCAAFPNRHNAFLPSSLLHRLLTAVHTKREILRTPRIQRACRLASLIYLNAALWDFRTSYSDTDKFLMETEGKVVDLGLHVNLSSEAFALTLFAGLDDPDFNCGGRPWFTAKMVNVAKRLSRGTWDKVNQFLLRCLMMRHGGSEGFCAWEEELRTELEMAPLSSYELAPALRWVEPGMLPR